MLEFNVHIYQKKNIGLDKKENNKETDNTSSKK